MSTLARDKKASLILFASAATAISLALFALYKANRRNKEGTQRAATNRERTTMGAPAGEKEVSVDYILYYTVGTHDARMSIVRRLWILGLILLWVLLFCFRKKYRVSHGVGVSR